eukprot:TRINITY_DN1970_c0_g1_i1.p1 TRINITY_DN1970_c0_g1~~TRINITY_DN1970_c0_g1_i1.p1  ORF type:complete len:292 (+),score=28.08 TRINITY_DN1970_c0_g1_i1:55-930(+)
MTHHTKQHTPPAQRLVNGENAINGFLLDLGNPDLLACLGFTLPLFQVSSRRRADNKRMRPADCAKNMRPQYLLLDFPDGLVVLADLRNLRAWVREETQSAVAELRYNNFRFLLESVRSTFDKIVTHFGGQLDSRVQVAALRTRFLSDNFFSLLLCILPAACNHWHPQCEEEHLALQTALGIRVTADQLPCSRPKLGFAGVSLNQSLPAPRTQHPGATDVEVPIAVPLQLYTDSGAVAFVDSVTVVGGLRIPAPVAHDKPTAWPKSRSRYWDEEDMEFCQQLDAQFKKKLWE